MLGCVGAQAQDLQWTTWAEEDGGNGHDYIVLMEPASWDAQKALAEDESGYLATTTSAEEQDFVMSVIAAAEKQEAAASDFYWFGLFQDPDGQEPDQGWRWLSGEVIDKDSYTDWGWGEPNNQGGEDVGALRKTSGEWIDGHAYVANRAVVEREPSKGPAPPAPPPSPSPDTTAPSLTLDSPEPAILPWRRPFRRKPVMISGQVVDDDSGVDSATITVTDEYGRCSSKHDITELLDEDGYFELTVKLRSWVKWRDRNGRTYEIALTAVDNAGNEAGPETVTVWSPHPRDRIRKIIRRWRH